MDFQGHKAQAACRRALAGVAVGLLLVAASTVQAEEYRAFWVDGWGAGFLNQTQVNNLLGVVGDANSKGQIRDANCNTVVVQVRRRFDTCFPSGIGEPYMSGLSPSNFNALQAMINAAHDTTGGKKRVQVHCWMVTFATGGGTVWNQHNDPSDPDNYWASLTNSGTITDDYAFDPGHPRCLQYVVNAAMDIVNRFDVDGIHWDYIRFTANNQGYNPTSIARYNTRYSLTGQPSASDEQFKQWRRDQVSAVIRQVYARIQAAKPNVLHSGSFVTWNPSPTSSTRTGFQGTRPYYDVFSDWDSWMQEGTIDVAFPMTYYNYASLPSDWTRWMNFEKDRHGNRHMVIGPGIYLNSLSNAILELQQTRTASPAGNYAHGFCGYSYRAPYSSGTWSGFSPSLVAQVTPTWEDTPATPWKTAPTKGHISGTVTYATSGEWADHATVSITGPESHTMYVDGTGFYAFIDLAPGTYTITAHKTGYADVTSTATVAIGQVTGNMYVRDMQLGGDAPPAVYNVSAASITNAAATINWTTDSPSTSQVQYGTTTNYGTTTPLDSAAVTSHGVNLSGLTGNTLYHYRVLSTNAYGTTTSEDYTFSTLGPPTISGIQVTNVMANTATVTWTTNNPSNSQVRYGLTASYESQTTVDSSSVTSHSVPLSGLIAGTQYHFQVVSSNTYGTATSTDQTFTTAVLTDDIIVDNADAGCTTSGSWSTGSSSAVPKIGATYLYASGTGDPLEAAITRTCRWTPSLPTAGLYDVYAYYQIGSNRTTGAAYKVVCADGDVTSVQNQNGPPNSGGWFLLGENLRFNTGTEGYVELGNNTPDTLLVSADAAKFVLKQSDTTPPTTPVVIDDGQYANSWRSLHATWSASDDETGVARYEYRIVGPGGTVARDWTNAGTNTEVTATDLSLQIGASYVFEVRAYNPVDLVSAVGASDGIRVFTYDVDNDGKVNETDSATFLGCLSGAGTAYAAGSPDCGAFDHDRDNDVDMEDFGSFQRCITGMDPNDPTCLD